VRSTLDLDNAPCRALTRLRRSFAIKYKDRVDMKQILPVRVSLLRWRVRSSLRCAGGRMEGGWLRGGQGDCGQGGPVSSAAQHLYEERDALYSMELQEAA